jgi:hypothetical protein
MKRRKDQLEINACKSCGLIYVYFYDCTKSQTQNQYVYLSQFAAIIEIE